MDKSPIVEIRNVTFSYGSDTVLRDVSLDVRQNDFLAVIGPNGGGKTTLLKLLLGLLRPNSGTVRVFGENPSNSVARMGYVPQDISAGRDFPITVFDVVLMGRLGFPKRFFRVTSTDRDAAREALETMDMWNYRKRRMESLSGGQRRRVFIARALASEPEILYLDEPTANIDAEGQRRVYEILKTLNERLAILVVSHDLAILLGYAKSVAHVNGALHHHQEPIVAPESLIRFAGEPGGHFCPVELLARSDFGKRADDPRDERRAMH